MLSTRTRPLMLTVGLFPAAIALRSRASRAQTTHTITEAVAYAISDTGLIVGNSDTAGQEPHAHPVAWVNGEIRDLGILPGSHMGEAFGANSLGLVVGYARFGVGDNRALLWTDGNITELGNGGVARGINDAGQIVGDFYGGGLWENGEVVDLGTLPGTTGNNAEAINRHGQIVGWARDATSDAVHAFLWDAGEIVMLEELPGAARTQAFGINASGQIVGSSGPNPSRRQAVLWEDGEMIDLGALTGDALSEALAINDDGEVVGTSGETAPERRAVHWENGEVTDLPTLPGTTMSWALDINTAGQVVGVCYLDGTTIAHPVLWEDGEIIELPTLADPGERPPTGDPGA